MNFTQIVYIGDKPVVITNNIAAFQSLHQSSSTYKVYQGLNTGNFALAISDLNNGGADGVFVNEPDENALYTHLAGNYRVIDAGGGLVYNDAGNIMMIFRRGKWDLPKGKLDEGETISECALREVAEETGISGLILGNKISETWHVYNEKSKNLVKHTTWFKMHSADTKELIPQLEEDILEVVWVNPANLGPYVANTYNAIKDVLKADGLLARN